MSDFRKFSKPRVAYLGLSLELYLETSPSLKDWDKAFKKWCKKLSNYADILYSRTCFKDAEIEEAAAKIEALQPDAIVLSALSYTPSMLVYPLAAKTNIPIIIWNTQDDAIISDKYVPLDLDRNHTVQGIHDITNVFFQNKIKYAIVSGHWNDNARCALLEEELYAAKAYRAAKNIKVLALGGAFVGMGDFEYDTGMLRKKWGPTVQDLDTKEFCEEAASINKKLVEKKRQEDLKFFAVRPDLDADVHRESIRRYFALINLLNKYDANAFTMNFTRLVKIPDFGQLPFYAINCSMAEGVGYAGEGDSLRAALMRQMIELTGIANFTEIYTIDWKRDLMFMSHMQECSIGSARKDRKIELRQMPFWVKGSPDYAGMYFTLEAGDYTGVSCTATPEGKWRFVAFEGTVPQLPFIDTYNRAYWLLRPNKPVAEFLDNYSLFGGAHHLAAVPGKKLNAIRRLAKWLDFDFVEC